MSFRTREFEKKLVEHGYIKGTDVNGDTQYIKLNETGEWAENTITKVGSDIFDVKISYHPTFSMISRRREDGFEEANGELYVFGTYGGFHKA